MVVIILFIIAAVLFALASFGVARAPLHLGWLGAALVAIALAIGEGAGG